jgi:uncharacterized protein Veg
MVDLSRVDLLASEVDEDLGEAVSMEPKNGRRSQAQVA